MLTAGAPSGPTSDLDATGLGGAHGAQSDLPLSLRDEVSDHPGSTGRLAAAPRDGPTTWDPNDHG